MPTANGQRWKSTVSHEPANRLHAIHPGHRDVHHDDVRLLSEGRLHGAASIRRLRDDLHVGPRLQHGAKTGEEEPVVVGDDETQSVHVVQSNQPSGMSRDARVPLPGADSISKLPPI